MGRGKRLFDWLLKYASVLTLLIVVVGGLARFVFVEWPAAERALFEEQRTWDGMLDEIVPQLSIIPGAGATWERNVATLPFNIQNNGRRAVNLTYVVNWDGLPYLGGENSPTLPTREHLKTQTCNLVYLKPGESIACDTILIVTAPEKNFDAVYVFNYDIRIGARTELNESMVTTQQLRERFKPEVLEKRAQRSFRATGRFPRPLNWTPPKS